jgi:protein O-GlcNAc transferase
MDAQTQRLVRRFEQLLIEQRLDEASLVIDDLSDVDEVYAVICRAQLDLIRGRRYDAMRALADVVARHPDHGRAWSIYAGVLFEMQRGEESLAAAQRAHALGQRDATAWYNLGRAQCMQGDWAAGETSFQVALKVDAGCAPATFGLARVALARRDPGLALERLSQVILHQPRYVAAYALASQIFISAGKPEDAKELLEKVFTAEPTFLPPAGLLLEVCLRTGDLTRAEQVAQVMEPVAVVVGDIDALKTLAGYHIQRDRIPEAEALLRRAVEAAPAYAEPRFRLAQLYERAGFPDLALGALEEAVSVDPDHPEAQNELASMLLERGGDDALPRALAHAQRAEALEPAYLPATFNQGVILAKLGDADAARPLLERVVQHPGAGPLRQRAQTLLRDYLPLQGEPS